MIRATLPLVLLSASVGAEVIHSGMRLRIERADGIGVTGTVGAVTSDRIVFVLDRGAPFVIPREVLAIAATDSRIVVAKLDEDPVTRERSAPVQVGGRPMERLATAPSRLVFDALDENAQGREGDVLRAVDSQAFLRASARRWAPAAPPELAIVCADIGRSELGVRVRDLGVDAALVPCVRTTTRRAIAPRSDADKQRWRNVAALACDPGCFPAGCLLAIPIAAVTHQKEKTRRAPFEEITITIAAIDSAGRVAWSTAERRRSDLTAADAAIGEAVDAAIDSLSDAPWESLPD